MSVFGEPFESSASDTTAVPGAIDTGGISSAPRESEDKSGRFEAAYGNYIQALLQGQVSLAERLDAAHRRLLQAVQDAHRSLLQRGQEAYQSFAVSIAE